MVIDQDRSVGRIYKDMIHGESSWFWAVNTSPFPAPPPNRGYAKSLDEAKTEVKKRYLEMRAQA